MQYAALIAVVAILAMPATVHADAPDVDQIVSRANLAAYYAGRDGRTEARMQIVDGRGREQQRQFVILKRDGEGGEQHYLVVFNRPSDVRGTAFLVHKRPGADDDRWLYLPGLDLVRRIAPGDKRTSFVGSHFFYEDVSGRHLDDDVHALATATDQHFVIRSTPREPSGVEFAAYTTWVDRDTWLPMRAEYEKADGTVYRRMEVLAVENIGGYPTAMQMRMSDLEGGGHTFAEMRFTAYDLDIPAGVFSERSLRNPPRQWLQRP